jgi:hypothetical protein
MPTSSAVEICSNALLQLGDRPIASFNENNDRTRLVSNLWESKMEKVLRIHPWNCATKQVILSPDSTAPVFDWASRFQLPTDWLRTIRVGLKDSPEAYDIQGRYILMDGSECLLTYIWRNAVVGTWDTLLVEAMTEVMKAALTYPITKSTSKQATEEEIVRRVLQSAKTINGQETPPEELGISSMYANRMR